MCLQFATLTYKIIQIKSEFTKQNKTKQNKNDNTPIYDDDDDFK
jgi:hypothetical protein